MTILAYAEQSSLFRGTSNEVPLIFGGIIMKNELEVNKVNMKRPMKLYLFIDSLKNRVSIQLMFHEGDKSSWKYHTLGSWKIPEHIANNLLTDVCDMLNFRYTTEQLASNIGLNRVECKIIQSLADTIEASLLDTPKTKLPVTFFKSASKQFYPSAKRVEYLLSIHKEIVDHIEGI